MSKIEPRTAQHIFSKISASAACGFNMFVQGDNSIHSSQYSDFAERIQGYNKAKEMADDGKIFYTHNFGCKCGGHAFMYGGFFVCNSCGGKSVNKDWWVIKVEKDGDQYFCHGVDFENIMESSNYAFGGTYSEAVCNYGEEMSRNE
jgi:hypothetical protein